MTISKRTKHFLPGSNKQGLLTSGCSSQTR